RRNHFCTPHPTRWVPSCISTSPEIVPAGGPVAWEIFSSGYSVGFAAVPGTTATAVVVVVAVAFIEHGVAIAFAVTTAFAITVAFAVTTAFAITIAFAVTIAFAITIAFVRDGVSVVFCSFFVTGWYTTHFVW